MQSRTNTSGLKGHLLVGITDPLVTQDTLEPSHCHLAQKWGEAFRGTLQVYQMKGESFPGRGSGGQLSGRASASHAGGPGFHTQHHKEKKSWGVLGEITLTTMFVEGFWFQTKTSLPGRPNITFK